MAVDKKMVDNCKSVFAQMNDRDLIQQYLRVRESGFIFEKEIALEEILWRMGYGRGGMK